MKKVLLLATGGTIASDHTAEGLSPQFRPEDLLAAVPGVKLSCEVESKKILDLDSTNMQPEEWQLIAHECYQALPYYDGIVISHGTDTLAYTSSALSFLLQNPGKPIVLTGSQRSIIDPEGDARKNLLDAFQVATSELKGIFVVFAGKVIVGNHAVKIRTQSFDAFDSVNFPLVATISAGELRYANMSNSRVDTPVHREAKLLPRLDPRVMLVKLTPGFEPDWLLQVKKLDIRGIVIEAYGCGGLPFYRRDLIRAVEELLAQGITVVLDTQVLYESTNLDTYEVGRKAKKAGVISAGVMTREAIVTKLMWVLGQTEDPAKIRDLMVRDIALETRKEW
ncbi:MAG TPA: asparaginase [Clostridiaceae bacterium]|nr:asparaginase [Clostridiaceae bacterium]